MACLQFAICTIRLKTRMIQKNARQSCQMKLNAKHSSVWLPLLPPLFLHSPLTRLHARLNGSCAVCRYCCCCCCRVACQRSTLSLNCLCHLGSRPHFAHFAMRRCRRLRLRCCLRLCLCLAACRPSKLVASSLSLPCTLRCPAQPASLMLAGRAYPLTSLSVCLPCLFRSPPLLHPFPLS